MAHDVFSSSILPSMRFGESEYRLVPVEQGRRQPSQLLKFDDPSLKDVEEFQYTKLKGFKKKIRLLQLRSGTIHGSDIFCELIEADYENSFHIPTKITADNDKSLRETNKGRNKPGKLWGANNENGSVASEEAKDESVSGEFGEAGDVNRLGEHAEAPAVNGLEKNEDDKRMEERRKEWNIVKAKEIQYEALSWCWGTSPEEYVVMIEMGGKAYKKKVREELAMALKYLRLRNQTRTLWIDAICIDQNDPSERNHQVQMMSRIYTRAKEVCIWLGEGTDESKRAIEFIRQEIIKLKNFDTICSDKRYSEKWQALMMLMQREWFSRRWVVQEIALASKATIHCGPDSIPWKEFAVAVELFVEVETATHRLSEVMQKDEKFRHVPGWFEYVSELGASLLVQATGKVFRAQRTPMRDDHARITPENEFRHEMQKFSTIDPLDRRSLLSLEYLVSTMFIFKATEPRDAIYAMLAIARDAAPFASSEFGDRDYSHLFMSLFDSFLEEKPFIVDYRRPYTDVCKDFIHFVIQRRNKLDPVQALDILCRPWALDRPSGRSIRLSPITDDESSSKRVVSPRTGPWMIQDASGEMKSDPRSRDQYWRDADKEILRGWDEIKRRYFPDTKSQKIDAVKSDLNEQEFKDMDLPSWVAQSSKAPFSLDHSAGIDILKTVRANADPLVGPPQDGNRNYNAAQTQQVKLNFLKFRRRPRLKHYSLYVLGFELDDVREVRDASQGGNIPKSWLELADWKEPYDQDPPDELWRTLVADRGRDNRNPPYYYATACKESVHKGSISSGRVDTAALVNNERNSIVAEFCRRVHAVIWNRSLFKTRSGRLGLASNVQEGDRVCILYGCTVPVILRRNEKNSKDEELENFEDQVELLKSLVQKCEKNCERKAKYRGKKVTSINLDEIRDNLKAYQVPKATREHDVKKEDPAAWYKFEGESYIHGMMDGEAMREKFYKGIEDRLFELR